MIISEARISILIAAYNEENNIGSAIRALQEALPYAEIVVVDDGSKDRTLTEAERLRGTQVKVLSFPHEGKGSAIRNAISQATNDIMVQLDADMQFPVEGIPALVQPILQGKADIVFGSRYLDSSKIEKGAVSLLKRMASYICAAVLSIICGQRYTDVFAGFKAWKREAINAINIQEDGFAYEAEIAIGAKRYRYRVIEVPTAYRARVKGESKIKFLYHMFYIPWRLAHILFYRR